MKILYVISCFNIYGGTPKKTLDLLGYFSKKSCLYSYSIDHFEHLKEFQKSGSNVYYPKGKSSFLSDFRSIISIIDEEQVDIIHTQFFRGELLGFLAKLMRPRLKLVVAFVGPFNPKGIKKLLSWIVYNFVDRFIFISDYVKREKVKEFPVIVRKNSHIIFNGTEKRSVTETPVPAVDGFVLLDVAGLVKWKNIDVLVEAMKIIVNRRKLTDIKLLIAGDGPEKDNLKKKIVSNNLQEHILLLGYHQNIGGLLNACDVFVHPAYAEGFGIAVIEAMMAGKTVVVSNAGALPELIDDQVNGLIVDAFNPSSWADAIEKLYTDKLFASKLSENAVQKALDKFSVDHFVKNYEHVYQDLVANSRD